jgi:outer membrane protein assembly factor BamB
VGKPVFTNGIAYVPSVYNYIIPDEPKIEILNIPVPHLLGAIYALNASSGVRLWNFTANGSFRSLDVLNGIVYVSISDSLYVDGKTAGGNIFALDANSGAQKWNYKTDGDIIWSSISDGVIYVFFHGSNSYVCAVKATNGEELWKWNVGDYVWLSQPTIVNGTIYLGTFNSANNHYYAINTANGGELWSVAVDGMVRGFSIVQDGRIYFNSDNSSYSVDEKIGTYTCAISAQNGERLWSYAIGFLGSYSPMVADNTVYVDGREATWENPHSFSGRLIWGTSNVFAINASSGNKIWSYSSNTSTHLRLIGGIVYFNSNGTLNALDASDGEQLWSISLNGNGPLIIDDNKVNYSSYDANAIISDGVLYYYLDQTLFAVDSWNGNSLWNYTTANNRSFLKVSDSTAYFAAGNTVYALSVPQGAHPSDISTIADSGAPVDTRSFSQGIVVLSVVLAVVVLAAGAIIVKKRITSRSTAKITF